MRQFVVHTAILLAAACGSSPGSRSTSPAERVGDPVADSVMTPRQITRASRPAIVRIFTYGSRASEPQRVGSGFLISRDGRVATNLHVIAGEPKVKVELEDGRMFDVVQVVSVDAVRDLVVLDIAAGELPALTLGDSDRMESGDPVVAIGHPTGGLDYSVSDGLISAWRRVSAETRILQISAPISQGSSGGPVFNDRGEVIGIATLIARAGQNLNFAVPSNYLRMLARQSNLKESPETFARRFQQPDRVKRDIPTYPARFLRGCADESLVLVVRSIGDAIKVGAPLYNQGQRKACFQIYENTVRLLMTNESVCPQIREALAAGLKRAEAVPKAPGPGAGAQEQAYSLRAWALRDTFDGLLRVISARMGEVTGS